MQRKFASLWEMSQEHGARQERTPQHSEESVLELASSGLSTLSEVGSQPPDHRPGHHDAEQNETEWETELPIEVEHPIHSIALATSEDSPKEANHLSARLQNALLNLRQQFDVHRADFYLGIAVVVAIFALLTPTPAAPQKPRLAPWQRVLVNLGIAEAPAPQVRYQGDPNIEVWVDPHTCLLYTSDAADE